MPFLRFSRDRRGYESTYLLQSSRRRGEQGRAALLYWFRTPPHVKLGRAAFDEETIRELEEQHPDVEFDWPHILAARPPAEPAEPERPSRRPPRRPDAAPPRHGGAPHSAPPPPKPDAPAGEAEPERAAPADDQSQDEPAATEPMPTEPEAMPLPETPEGAPRRFVRVFDAPGPRVQSPEPSEDPGASAGEDETAPHHLSEPSAVERILGSDRLNRLRGQHAACLARIATRVTDPALAERLRAVADRADPDAWVTAADVEAGLACLDAVYAEIARHAGRRRRRRRRRGGSSGPPAPGGPAADSAEGPEGGDDSPGSGESSDDQG